MGERAGAEEWAAEWEVMVNQLAGYYDGGLSGAVTLAKATDLVRPMTNAALRWLAVRYLAAAARDESRRRALVKERNAFTLEPEVPAVPVLASVGTNADSQQRVAAARSAERAAKANLWQGRYRHGSMAFRDGAANRDCPCADCERARESTARKANELNLIIAQAMEDYSVNLRKEWTAHLLSTPFALPNGDRVTWGSATAAQHQERVEMFKGQVTAGVEGGARHLAAIRDIETLRVACLDEAVVAISA